MFDLFQELSSVIEALDKEGIAYALVGGLAYSILVESRATEDIDLLVTPEAWPRIPEVLRPLGYLELAEPMDFAHVRIRRLTKIQQKDVLVLDFVLAEKELTEGIQRAVSLKHGGQEFRVAPPDVIIALKKGRMSPKDRNDIEGLQRLLDGGN